MPKKNAFFFFMMQRKDEIVRSGTKLTRGLTQVAGMIDSEWKEMSSDQKEIYKQMADEHNSAEKMAKSQSQQPEGLIEGVVDLSARQANSPITFSDLGEQVMVKYRFGPESLAKMRSLIANLLHDQNLELVPISILQFSSYNDKRLEAADDLLVAEVGLTVFNIKTGIISNFAALVDPGPDYPKARKNDVAIGAKKLALPMPGYDKRAQDYLAIVQQLFLIGNTFARDGRVVFYCLSDQLIITELSMKWLMLRAGLYTPNLPSGYDFDLLPLEDMIAMMTSRLDIHGLPDYSEPWSPPVPARGACSFGGLRILTPLEVGLTIMREETEGYMAPRPPHISRGIFYSAKEVVDYLSMDNFAYRDELACPFHSVRRDGVYYCPLNIANRYAFNLLNVLPIAFQTCPIAGRHYPTILHDDGEERRRRREMLRVYEIFDPTELGLQEAAKDKELQEAAVATQDVRYQHQKLAQAQGDRYRQQRNDQRSRSMARSTEQAGDSDWPDFDNLSDAFKNLKTRNSP